MSAGGMAVRALIIGAIASQTRVYVFEVVTLAIVFATAARWRKLCFDPL